MHPYILQGEIPLDQAREPGDDLLTPRRWAWLFLWLLLSSSAFVYWFDTLLTHQYAHTSWTCVEGVCVHSFRHTVAMVTKKTPKRCDLTQTLVEDVHAMQLGWWFHSLCRETELGWKTIFYQPRWFHKHYFPEVLAQNTHLVSTLKKKVLCVCVFAHENSVYGKWVVQEWKIESYLIKGEIDGF